MHKRKLVMALLVAAAPALWAQSSTSGSTFTRTQDLPPVGLAASESAQINLVNIAAASSSGTAASCTGAISFLNSSGTVIGSATTYTLGTNQSKSVTLPYASVGATGRTSIRGVVTQTTTEGSGVPCQVLVSFEIFDTSTGATHVYIAANEAGYGPQGGGPGH